MSDFDESTLSPPPTPNSTNKPIAIVSIASGGFASTVSDLESPPGCSSKRRTKMPPKHHGLHVSQKKVELTEAAKRELAVEKNLVKFRVPHEEITSLDTSLWGTVKHVDWSAMSEYRKKQMQENEKVFEIAMYKGLTKLYAIYDEEMAKEKTDLKTLAKRVCICSMCFDDPNRALNLCIIGTGNLATSNIKQHNNSYHASIPGPYLYRSINASQKKEQHEWIGCEVCWVAKLDKPLC
jgi:hypothetical protein